MANTLGLVASGRRSLPGVVAPLADELGFCWWLVDVQGGPLLGPRDDADERFFWPVPGTESSSTHGLRRGAFRRLVGRLAVDEWSYYYAIQGGEAEALGRATLLAHHVGDFSVGFLRRFGEFADLFVIHADGWWELYTPHAEWHARLKAGLAGSRARALVLAGVSPADER